MIAGEVPQQQLPVRGQRGLGRKRGGGEARARGRGRGQPRAGAQNGDHPINNDELEDPEEDLE